MVHCSLESVSLNSFWRKSLSKKPFFKSVFASVKVTSSSTPPGSNEGIASGGYISLFFFMLNELHVLFIGLFVSIALLKRPGQLSCRMFHRLDFPHGVIHLVPSSRYFLTAGSLTRFGLHISGKNTALVTLSTSPLYFTRCHTISGCPTVTDTQCVKVPTARTFH